MGSLARSSSVHYLPSVVRGEERHEPPSRRSLLSPPGARRSKPTSGDMAPPLNLPLGRFPLQRSKPRVRLIWNI